MSKEIPYLTSDEEGRYWWKDHVICTLCYEGNGEFKRAKWTAHLYWKDENHEEYIYLCDTHIDDMENEEDRQVLNMWNFVQET